jgi:hypothetical protein
MKKITNVTNVMMMKSRNAQRIRLIRYRTISPRLAAFLGSESYRP